MPEIGVMSFIASRTICVVSKRRRLVTAPDVLVKYEVCRRTSMIRGAEKPPTISSYNNWGIPTREKCSKEVEMGEMYRQKTS
jgi:hypothetical protein